MCEYCTEFYVLQLLEREQQKNYSKIRSYRVSPLQDIYYLRECVDFVSAFKWYKTKVSKIKEPMDEYDAEIIAEIILMRAMEICFEQGFNSPIYQRLLRNSLFMSFINMACSMKEPICNFLKTSEDLGPLSILYNSDTYLKHDCSLQQQQLDHLLPACHRLLDDYQKSCLTDIKGNYYGRDAMPKSPIRDLFRALYYSIHMVGSYLSNKKVLWQLAYRDPNVGGDISGPHLWLGRVAVLKLFDFFGFCEFLKRFKYIRSLDLAYIGFKRGYNKEQKDLLREAACQYSDSEITRYPGTFGRNELLNWLDPINNYDY